MIAVLMMIKDEEKSIKVSIDSFKYIIDTVIVLDTGSTDKTIDIIKSACARNKQKLYLKESVFKSFPESRNEAIEFAETIKDIKYLILMDAGDELKTKLDKNQFNKSISSIPTIYNHALIKHNWLVNGIFDDHYDVRFIRNHKNCRYDLKYLVHEKFKNVKEITNISNIFYLYQNRDLYGISTQNRYIKDIENLLKSVPNKRNLYYLGQTYLSMEDFENAYKYNLLSYEKEEDDDEDEVMGDHILKNILVRIGYSAIRTDKNKNIIFKYLEEAITKFSDPPIEAFIFLMSYSIDKKITDHVMKYVRQLFQLQKPSDLSMVNHSFYDYKRWNIISILCLLSNQEIELGRDACKKALSVGTNKDDLNNMQVYNFLFSKK